MRIGLFHSLLLIFGLLAGHVWARPSSPPHDFHVSVTQINCNAQTQSVEITIKLFTDDMEQSIKSQGGGDLRLGDAREAANADQLLLEYLRNRFALLLDGKPAVMAWVGKEVEVDALWCYLEVPNIAHISSMEITSRILTEIFEDQANVVHISCGEQNKSMFLSKISLSERVSL